jgi:uncharacterized protein (DUF2252 family)
MKVYEIISEGRRKQPAHHALYDTIQLGQWIVDIDTHLMSSIAARSDQVDIRDVTAIISYACHSPFLSAIVPGKGAFVKDTNTNIAIFIHRYLDQPSRLRAETVLTPDMKTRDHVITVTVPSHDLPRNPKTTKNIANMRATAQVHGRDYVSQEIEKMQLLRRSMVGMDRQERREFMRRMEKSARKLSSQKP